MIGATTVQALTDIMWNGYEHFQKLLAGISEYMDLKGLSSLHEIRGLALHHI